MDRVADFYLQEWARWRWTGHGAAKGYQTRATFDRLRGSAVRNATIDDPAALLVDQAVSQLCREDAATGRCVCAYYLDRQAPHQIGERMGWSHQRAAGAVRRGVDRVGEILDE